MRGSYDRIIAEKDRRLTEGALSLSGFEAMSKYAVLIPLVNTDGGEKRRYEQSG